MSKILNKRENSGTQKTWWIELWVASFIVVSLVCLSAQAQGSAKTARGNYGMAASSSPYATRAAVSILEAGGNAVDAAAAACFVLTVTDPPMASLGGRAQIVVYLSDGRVIGLDGATETPRGVPPREGDEDERKDYQLIPVPGNPAALSYLVQEYGRLPLADVLGPAIRLAEDGFVVTRRVGEIWQESQDALAANPGAAQSYLKPDGKAYGPGDYFRHPRLAAVLRRIAQDGPDAFYRGEIAGLISEDVRSHGGYLSKADLANYRPIPGAVVRTNYRGFEVISLGRHAWGNTLIEMLNLLSNFEIQRAPPSPDEVELLARVIQQALQDRPQMLGSLEPKEDGFSVDTLSSSEFAQDRAREIRDRMRRGVLLEGASTSDSSKEHETTHLSVIDADGNAVSLTTSIGPRFGRRLASPDLGFLYAHSYQMRSRPAGGKRDLTEMTPTIVLHDGRPILAVGAAGSARIPGAILQILSNVIDRAMTLESAVDAPRVYWQGEELRIHDNFSIDVFEHLRNRGFELDLRPRGITRHLGMVQAVGYELGSKEYVGVADSAYDGTAAGPGRPEL